ncbi:flagellar protein FliS [Desulfobaculum xiamenense]|uniref:Flagellar protein FliS n=1 Tax=Desulfobaculum xiamenense TaxID=995050 RepID=A0A846QKD3_9BACT|nr:flagellar export chaperone FliS [Desulfobaculum xiamenense]NJB67597.1 flagellar protein FliS [Desulfobaculum xiamenense]
MQKGAKAYLKTQIGTTSQGDILILLYDGAIKYLRQAKEKIAERDYAQKGMLISRAMDVIAELDQSLNAEKGGEVAQNLHQLYFFCNTRLLRANMDMNTEIIDEVIRILDGLKDAFREIQGKPSAPATASETTPTASAPEAPQHAEAQPHVAPSAPQQSATQATTPPAATPLFGFSRPIGASSVPPRPAVAPAPVAPATPPEPASQPAQEQHAAQQPEPAQPSAPAPAPGLFPTQPIGRPGTGTMQPRPLRPGRAGMPGTYGPSGLVK